MMGTVYYAKLVTGEEVVGTLVRHGQDIALMDPMTMEYGESETGSRFIFMARYNQFASDKTIHVDRKNVVFMSEVMPEVQKYYESSLDYCKRVTDRDFKSGMVKASRGVDPGEPTSDSDQEPEIEFSLSHRTLH